LWSAVLVDKIQARWRATTNYLVHPISSVSILFFARNQLAAQNVIMVGPYVLFCGDLNEFVIEKVDDSDSTIHRRVQRRIWVQVVQHSCSAFPIQRIGHLSLRRR